ncbi:leucine-rich repeat-containing protein [Dictyostelium discoideum AX4]|uniref:MAP kinase phosphatase with leucine-rich repeats protein 1 n=1 Tax=Dictyostelium discoideum TaxID=44689 RepID=MPL1_DICDI|nr:leucine-rich repeat-containing protein [Dictyostelium discoideum AX4]Q55CS7.1 RecName: Full=MAP kinase phosphatase with leucine-rich repeats protein 1 [Dictyostelium discoideum]EAL72309.1 leucine-rich repeat-containing protein [Dictyostelium discoideum AX4]|eukprot:XP_646404.1 leucine-rich repeat-containing protein [Dictyostelium discoideum AX4]
MIFKKLFSKGSTSPTTRPRGATFSGTFPTDVLSDDGSGTNTNGLSNSTTNPSSIHSTPTTPTTTASTNLTNSNKLSTLAPITNGNRSLRGSKDGSGTTKESKKKVLTLNEKQKLLLKSMEYIKGSGTYYGNYMEFYEIPIQIYVGTEPSETYPSLSYNTELRSLILDFNKITEIPEQIGLLPNLKHLSLAANQLSQVPEFLSQLKSLESLELGINQFTSFPLNICKIKSLTLLRLETNNIKSLPDDFINLENLKDLSLLDNQLKEIPDSLPNNIEKLNLGCNDIINSYSKSLIRISHSLTTLNLSENKIEVLDESLSCLVNVKTLILDCNMIKVIPGSVLGSWKSLVTLNLPHNFISDLPAEIVTLDNLRIIDLRGNNFEFCKNYPSSESSSILFKIEEFIKDKEKLKSLILKENLEILSKLKDDNSTTTTTNINSNLDVPIIITTNIETIPTTSTTATTTETTNDITFKISDITEIIEKTDTTTTTTTTNQTDNVKLEEKVYEKQENDENNSVTLETTTTISIASDNTDEASIQIPQKEDGDKENLENDDKLLQESFSENNNNNNNEKQQEQQENPLKESQGKIQQLEEELEKLEQKQLELKDKIRLEKIKYQEIQQQSPRLSQQENNQEAIVVNTQPSSPPPTIIVNEQKSEKLENEKPTKREQPMVVVTKNNNKAEVEMTAPNQLIFWQSIVPDLIIDKLYLGCRECAMNKSWLKDNNVTHILTVANFKPLYPDLFKYLIINIDDVDEANIYQYFKEMNTFIDEGREKGGVLIHCRAGVSRSATATIAYIMMKNSVKFQEAFDITIKGRSRIYPNRGFLNQLKKFEKDLSK